MTISAPITGAARDFASWGFLICASAFGLSELILPDEIHNAIEQPAGALLVVLSLLYVVKLRRSAAGKRRREHAEEELGRSEERLELAQSVAGVGVWDFDLTTGEVMWSKSIRDLNGVDAGAKASYEAFLALVHEDDRARVDRTIAEAVDRAADSEFEYRLVRSNGEMRRVMSRGRAIRDERGRTTRMIGVAMDITDRHEAEAERAKLEQRLVQAQKLEAVGQLAGGVAHDFNNLLLAMRGYGELALGRLERGDDGAAGDLREVLTAADRAADLTRQLLAFSRRQVMNPEVLDLNDVAGEMDKLLRRLIDEQIEFVTVRTGDAVLVKADRGHLEQVIANLAVNARDAMPDGGRLTIEVATAELHARPHALLAVTDTGLGMDAETTARIFEPFFTTKGDRGTGLGLATVHGIVMQSGGQIVVYSEPGHGTTFKIYLPLSAGAVAAPKPPAPFVDGGTETVLVVEDDPAVRSIVCTMLEARGYDVLGAEGGDEALAAIEQHDGRVALVLSDLIMRGLNGRQTVDRIRETQPDTKVLYMSGYTDDTVIRSGALEPGTAFIQKPFSGDDLATRVRELLDRQPA